MEQELRRRIVVALIIALLVTAIEMAVVRLTAAMATLMFIQFSAHCPLVVAMSMIYRYRERRDRFKLVLCVTGFAMYLCAKVAFELMRDDLYPAEPEGIFEIAAGHAVAIAWAVIAAWLLEAGMERRERTRTPA